MPKQSVYQLSTGQRFDRLTVIDPGPYFRKPDRQQRCVCICECGKQRESQARYLFSGDIRSCGCLRAEAITARDIARATHRLSTTMEYKTWQMMRQRCENPKDDHYHNYGGRGIAVCDRWQSFEMFLSDMGNRPTSKHSLDRFPDNDGNYEPGNCRWAAAKEQQNNKRSNRSLKHEGETMTIAQWAERLDINPKIISLRLRMGWDIGRALTVSRQKPLGGSK